MTVGTEKIRRTDEASDIQEESSKKYIYGAIFNRTTRIKLHNIMSSKWSSRSSISISRSLNED